MAAGNGFEPRDRFATWLIYHLSTPLMPCAWFVTCLICHLSKPLVPLAWFATCLICHLSTPLVWFATCLICHVSLPLIHVNAQQPVTEQFQQIFIDPGHWTSMVNTSKQFSSRMECACVLQTEPEVQGVFGAGFAAGLPVGDRKCQLGVADVQSKGNHPVFVRSADVQKAPPMLVVFGGDDSNTRLVLRASGSLCQGHGIPSLLDPGIKAFASVVAQESLLFVTEGRSEGGLQMLDMSRPHADWTWETRKAMPDTRYRFGMESYGQKLYAFGGRHAGANKNTVLEYDISSDTWRTLTETLNSSGTGTQTVKISESLVWIYNMVNEGFEEFDLAAAKFNRNAQVPAVPRGYEKFGYIFMSRDLGRFFAVTYTPNYNFNTILSLSPFNLAAGWGVEDAVGPDMMPLFLPVDGYEIFIFAKDASGTVKRSQLHEDSTMDEQEAQLDAEDVVLPSDFTSVLVEAKYFEGEC